ncbi:MAG: uridine diphosphate-N-acetylglucosamine-binding protein YvcK, partial [Acidobacteria bacterium]|nr:uridine diphosphate-N-acetylglucosamine-binding protein YvcK [Acidobacteriota bacterium]
WEYFSLFTVTMDANARINWVAIGGGTGLSTLLSGLRPHLLHLPPDGASPVSLAAIVTVSDNGKSSGRLRGEFRVLPPGDVRNCLVALADDSLPMTRLFRHRFPGAGEVGGHSLGNLVLLALNQMNGNFLTAIDQARALLGIKARVLPSTLDQVDLVARIDGRSVRGQVAIKSQNAPIRELALAPPDVKALPQAVEAILAADLITLGPGSLFTSVVSNLLIPDIRAAVAESRARKIYICNVMTEYDETHGMSAVDHVVELLRYAPDLELDAALFNSAPISSEMCERYAAERAVALAPPEADRLPGRGTRLISVPLASEERFVRHDPARLSRAIIDVFRKC